jgi:hypothetical protein
VGTAFKAPQRRIYAARIVSHKERLHGPGRPAFG